MTTDVLITSLAVRPAMTPIRSTATGFWLILRLPSNLLTGMHNPYDPSQLGAMRSAGASPTADSFAGGSADVMGPVRSYTPGFSLPLRFRRRSARRYRGDPPPQVFAMGARPSSGARGAGNVRAQSDTPAGQVCHSIMQVCWA